MFVIGNTYNRVKDIHTPLGGQRQGGISTPARSPYVVLFTGKSGESLELDYGFIKKTEGNQDEF